MKNFEEMNYNERNEIVELFSNWLKDYTHEVIVRVMEKRDEIISNEFSIYLLKELKEREDKEKTDFMRSIGELLSDFDSFNKYDPHNYVLTHSQSYRDVLYDMYIRQ